MITSFVTLFVCRILLLNFLTLCEESDTAKFDKLRYLLLYNVICSVFVETSVCSLSLS